MAFLPLLGLLIGVALVVGPLSWWSAPVDAINGALVSYAGRLTGWLVDLLGRFELTAKAAGPVGSTLAVLAPGLIVLLLVSASLHSDRYRRNTASLLLVGSSLSFAVLPAGSALVLVGGALLAGAFLRFATGWLLTVPLMALATVLAARFGICLWHGHVAAIDAAVRESASFLPADSGEELVRPMLLILSLVPFAWAIEKLVTTRR